MRRVLFNHRVARVHCRPVPARRRSTGKPVGRRPRHAAPKASGRRRTPTRWEIISAIAVLISALAEIIEASINVIQFFMN